jgi:hypothetical protein
LASRLRFRLNGYYGSDAPQVRAFRPCDARSRRANNSGISRVPTGMRADHYLETWLGPASDRVGVAAKVLPRLIKHRRRLDDYRTALSDLRMVDKLEQPSISEIPTGGRLHRWGV